MINKMAGIRIAQVHCGKDIIDVTVSDKQATCYFNHISVLSSKDINTFGPIVGMLVGSSCQAPKVKISLKGDKSSYTDFLKDLVDTVEKSDQAKVQVLDSKPDEIAGNKPKEASSKFDQDSLENYRENTKLYADCFDGALTLSEVLLKTKLPKVAHSFKEIDKIFARVKLANEDLSKGREACELASEHSGIRVGQIITAMNSSRPEDPQIRKIIQAAVSHVVTDFVTMKKLLASLITTQYPLYDIDRVFKQASGYPATWFFDPSVYYNFKERYKDASDSLINAVRAEASVVRPLFNWNVGSN